ncbi:MAG: FAD-dependent oxidoreductase [Chloroflexi bacterium]|nr:FAD-dependent oxidoreductase [Chloroflexota bacterium]MCL5026000.1 FAD-dependent oxidoreductase [Chloroflexota bacterium]
MANLINGARNVWETQDVDVLVAGGGPAGLGAAIGAARMGARTLLVERMGFLGGVGAIGLGMTINAMRPDGKPRSLVHEAFLERLTRFGDIAYRYEENGLVDHAYVTNTEYLKLAAFQALEDAGCEYLLHSFVSDAIVERDAVRGVIVSTKSGPLRINAKRVVDATGDGDVLYFAGCPVAKGREEDGFLSPMTSLFVIGGVDVDRIVGYQRALERDSDSEVHNVGPRWTRLLADGRREGYEVPERMHLRPTVYPGSVYVNHAGNKLYGVLDGTNVNDLTKAERLMRQQAVDVVRLLKDRNIPGFENAYLEQVSAWAGVRETRRVVGEYVLTEEDAKTGARFPDAIARRFGLLDVGYVRLEKMTPHDVPYRALVPKRIDNILASGRNISTTHVAMSAGKSMGNCMATGHAAGVASVLSIRQNVAPREVNTRLVREALARDGVPLDI